jgi:hypothetical protein
MAVPHLVGLNEGQNTTDSAVSDVHVQALQRRGACLPKCSRALRALGMDRWNGIHGAVVDS